MNDNAMMQERAFLEGEADAWIRRNPSSVVRAEADEPVLAALAAMPLPERGALLDVGGAAGRIAAGFLAAHPAWSASVVDASGEAIAAGRRAFPHVDFQQGSISRPLPTAGGESGLYDVVLIAGVLCWVDRACLSQAIANTDAVLADGGLLVVADFGPPYPIANPYIHRPGLYTYKQDYAACYVGLGIYHPEYRRSLVHGSAANPADPYDRHWTVSVLRKDLHGRYARVAG